MTTIDELSRTVKDQADMLDALAKRLGSLGRAEIERSYVELEARLADAIPLRTGSYPTGAEVFAAGSTEPGQTNLLADGSVTLPAFGPTTRPVVIATVLPSLPNTLYPIGSTVVVEGTGVLYRNVSNVWVAAVGAIAGGIAALGALPSLPDSAYPTGSVVYLTTDGKLYRNVAGTWSKAVDGGDITASTILADSIGAGQITAAKLAATILLASTIKTAETGNIHVEISSGGIVLLDASNVPLVILPTNGDPVYVKGAVVASSLTSLAAAELRGTTLLPTGAVLTAASAVQAPTAAPTLVESVPATALGFGASGLGAGLSVGFVYDSSDTSYYGLWMNNAANATYVIQWDADGTYIRSAKIRDGVAPPNGLAINATHIFSYYQNGRLYKTLKSDLSYVTDVSMIPTGDTSRASLMYEVSGDKLIQITATGTGGTSQIRFRTINPSDLSVGSDLDGTGYAIDGSTHLFRGGYDDGTYYWVVSASAAEGEGVVRRWQVSDGAYVANSDFGLVGVWSDVHDGLAYNGSAFVGRNYQSYYTFTDWTWTTESAKYWVGYSWYDPDGTTHETALGPRASITMNRRTRLQVTNAAIPGAGGADDPDNARVYMERNATEPAAGNYKLQVTDALTSRYLTTFATGGAADGGGTAFPAGSSGELKSASAGWTLKGSGAINRTGTSFPPSPATNDQRWRSDSGMEFFYDGTRWLSTQLFVMPMGAPSNNPTLPLSATTNDFERSTLPYNLGSDIWLEDWLVAFYVSGGTALSGSHKWDFVLKKNNINTNTQTTVATSTVSSGSTDQYRRQAAAAIDALMNTTTMTGGLTVSATKTGTPGNVYVETTVTYRIVAT